jgi:hypothetical protein
VKLVAAALLVLAVAGVAAQANAAKGWHRCQALSGYHLGSLCDGRGRVLFPYVLERNENSGYTQVVTGFRQTDLRHAIVDVHADWGILQGDCGQNCVYQNCTEWGATERLRYRTADGGRHWLPVRFHRKAGKSQGPGPDPPVETGSVEDDPPLHPCDWSHSQRHVLSEGIAPGLGNWCAPPDEWTVPDSLQLRAS